MAATHRRMFCLDFLECLDFVGQCSDCFGECLDSLWECLDFWGMFRLILECLGFFGRVRLKADLFDLNT